MIKENFNIELQQINQIVNKFGQKTYENQVIVKNKINLVNIINYLKKEKICLLVNFASGVGHVIAETDFAIRKVYLKEINAEKFWIILPSNHLAKQCMNLYEHYFDFVSFDQEIYNLFLPIIMHEKDLTYDIGLSRLKWQKGQATEGCDLNDGNGYIFQINKKENRLDWEDYYKTRKLTQEYYPLKIQTSKEEIEDILNVKFNKLALFHGKNVACNASASPLNVNSYYKTINYLQKNDYTVVFGGRESFGRNIKNVINYAESKNANLINDIKIISLCNITLFHASGASLIAECVGTKMLYLGFWHIARIPFPKNNIYLPTLIKKNKILKFIEQIELYNNMPDIGAELFPKDYTSIEPTDENILEATKELINLKNEPMSDLQYKFSKIHNEGQIVDGLSRCSQNFLEIYKDLF